MFSLYGIHMTDGEIANTLAKQHKNWLSAYEHLKNDIRSSPVVHVDETPWKIQANDGLGYAWSLSDANSQKVYFSLENSRGARHAKKLFGADTNKPFSGIRISDDYGGYRSSTLPGKQQLCWAHLYRCIRDLRYNSNIPKEQVTYVTWWYEQFANIYQDLRTYLDQPYNKQTRATQSNALWQRLQPLTQTAEQASIAEISDPNEPKKLKRLKAQLLRAGQEKLFTCLIYDTPCDNNRAERDLRQLVLKRKRSFGSQTEKGATALSTILSLCTTTWRMQPNGYFRALAELG
jgi:transposase